MESFLQLCDDAKKQLGRKLRDDEVIFLQWMFNRYSEEQHEIGMKCSEA